VWQSALCADLKPLAAALADIANDDGTSIFPSVGYMCWLLGRSERSVQMNLASLRKLGVLAVVSNGGGRTRTTEYRLIETNLPKRAPWESRNPATIAGFRRRKGAVDGTKPRSLQHEKVQPTAPDTSYPSVEPSSAPRSKEARRRLRDAREAVSALQDTLKADDDKRAKWQDGTLSKIDRKRLIEHIETAKALVRALKGQIA